MRGICSYLFCKPNRTLNCTFKVTIVLQNTIRNDLLLSQQPGVAPWSLAHILRSFRECLILLLGKSELVYLLDSKLHAYCRADWPKFGKRIKLFIF